MSALIVTESLSDQERWLYSPHRCADAEVEYRGCFLDEAWVSIGIHVCMMIRHIRPV
jgi:hypothetical protein